VTECSHLDHIQNVKPHTSTRPRIPSCDRLSRGRIGDGVTSTKLNWILPRNRGWDTLATAGNVLALLCWSIRQRKPDLETGVPGFGIHLNTAPVLLHNSLHRVKAEPGSFPDSLGGEERFEDV